MDRQDLLRAAPRPDPATEVVDPVPLVPVDAIEVTTLVDNVTDLTLADDGPARRAPVPAAGVSTGLLEGGRAPDVLLAEHGFSALVRVRRGRRTCNVLFDAGVAPTGMVENMRRLEIDPHDVDVIVCSHGHFDHTTGLDGFVSAVGRANLPVLVHPEFWTRRRVSIDGREPIDLPATSRSALVGAGFEIVERPEPSFLLDGSLLVTGEVDRTTDFETGFPGHEARRGGRWESDPWILDDQALIAHVRGRGLVVVTGCGHAGLVNLLRYARRLTGVEELYAVMGGFHLAGRAFQPLIPPTVEAVAEMRPDVVVPAHCAGRPVARAIEDALPGTVITNSVGTRLDLVASAA